MSQFNSNGNKFMSLLSEANDLHLSVGAKHAQLLDLCKANGVKFEDTTSYLINQAKRAGLYRKTLYNSKKGKYDYPPKSSLKVFSWYNAISRFNSWKVRNYVAYGEYRVKSTKPAVEKVIAVRKVDLPGNPKVINTADKPIKINVPDMAPAPQSAEDILKSQEEVRKTPDSTPKGDGSTGNQQPVPEANTVPNIAEIRKNMLTKPVETDLSLAEKQALMIRNRSVMAEMCKENGAIAEWNTLCDKMMWEDVRIPEPQITAVG